MRLEGFSLPEPHVETDHRESGASEPALAGAVSPLETIERDCRELGARARQLGLRHVDYLMAVAAEEIRSRRV